MDTDATPPEPGSVPAAPGLTVRADGVITHRGLSVGMYEDREEADLLVLNLGWFRLAGLSIRVEDDPQSDRHQTGLTLERLVDRRT